MNYKIILEMGVTIMTNKEKLKKAIEQDINPKDCYKEIINKIERGEKTMKKKNNNMWKWTLVPICLIAIISGILLINDNKELNPDIYKSNIETKDSVNLYINDVSKMTQGVLSSDADVKITTIESISYFKEIVGIKIPSDFNNKEAHEIYIKPDRDSQEYNVLQSYVVNYSNTENDRNIIVSFSKDNKPIRDYYFSEEGSKMSKINNIELKIYKYNDLYFTEFNYEGINFDIETSKITEQELIDLLLSIIK